MFKATPHTYPNPSDGLLTVRLPSYISFLQLQMQDLDVYVKTLKLFSELFGHLPQKPRSLMNIELRLAAAINESLFPLDEDVVRSMIIEGEPLINKNSKIPLAGEGLAWHYDGFYSFRPSEQILLIILAPAMIDQVEADAQRLIEGFWQRHGYQKEQTLPWIYHAQGLILELLEDLPVPLDGLRTLYETIQGYTFNPFIDWSISTTWGHMGEYPEWQWNKHDIRELTRLYNEVAPLIAKLHDYKEWFATTPNAEAITLRHLINLCPDCPPIPQPY